MESNRFSGLSVNCPALEATKSSGAAHRRSANHRTWLPPVITYSRLTNSSTVIPAPFLMRPRGAASGGDFDETDFRRRNGIVHPAADLKDAFDRFFDVLRGFFFGLALRDATGQGGTLGNNVAVFTSRESYNELFHTAISFHRLILAYPVDCQSCYWVSPLATVERLVSGCRGMRRETQDRVECRHWVEAPVEPEHKFVEVSL